MPIRLACACRILKFPRKLGKLDYKIGDADTFMVSKPSLERSGLGLSDQQKLEKYPTIGVHQAPSSMASMPHYQPELDALRFFAFLAVFVFHDTRALAAPGRLTQSFANSLAYGMQVFFVLSSYLISKLLLREREATGTIHIKAFYTRRILRIWPLYFAFLFSCALLGLVFAGFHTSSGRLIAFIMMVGNWYVGTFGFGISPIYPLWSISLEEQFYLIWPAIVKRSGRFLAYFTFGLIPLSLICIALQCWRGASPDQIVTNTSTEFLYFAVGTLLAVVMDKRTVTKGVLRDSDLSAEASCPGGL